ncbi:MAG: hypothetical protein ABI867_13605 [Kofleriaceae bacterium]
MGDRSQQRSVCRVVAKNPAETTDNGSYSSFFVLCDIPAVSGTNRSGIALYRSTTH